MGKKIITILYLVVAFVILVVSFWVTLRRQNAGVNNQTREFRKNEAVVANGGRVVHIDTNEVLEGKSSNENEGWASYYNRNVCQPDTYGSTCKTANGEIFDDTAFTLASNNLPFHTVVELCFRGECVECRVNDRGNFTRLGREFDLAFGCASAIGIDKVGVGKVNWRIIPKEN